MVYDFKKQCESSERKFLLLLDKFAESRRPYQSFYETHENVSVDKSADSTVSAYHDIDNINGAHLYTEAKQYIEPTEHESFRQTFGVDTINEENESVSVVELDDESLHSLRHCEQESYQNTNQPNEHESFRNFRTNVPTETNESSQIVVIDDESIAASEERCEMVAFSGAHLSNEPMDHEMHHNYGAHIENETVMLDNDNASIPNYAKQYGSVSAGTIEHELPMNCRINNEPHLLNEMVDYSNGEQCGSAAVDQIHHELQQNCEINNQPQLLNEMVCYPNTEQWNESAEYVSFRNQFNNNVDNETNDNLSAYNGINETIEAKFDGHSLQRRKPIPDEAHQGEQDFKPDIEPPTDPMKQITIVAESDANPPTTTGQIQCDICKRNFTALHYLVLHMKMHIRTIDMHARSTWNIKNPNDGTKQYMCDICGKGYSSLYYISDHMRVHSGNLKECDICDKRFITDGHLNTHMARHRRKKLSLATWYTRKMQMTNNDGSPAQKYKCEICGKVYSSPYYIEQHMQLHLYGADSKLCKICHKRFATDGGLKSHLSVHTNIRPFACKVCGKTFRLAQGLTQHNLIHTGERPFKCTHCAAAFRQKASLQQHFIGIHTTERPHACVVCDKRFKTKDRMIVHFRRHTGERPYACQVCNRGFASSSQLSTHKLVHTDARKKQTVQRAKGRPPRHGAGENAYACTVCDKRFKSKVHLAVHFRLHTGERPFQCSVCHKRFTNATTLQLHNMIHTGERPHKCTLCAADFRLKHLLRQHWLIKHTTEKPYACTGCNKRFKTKEQMTVHYRQHTGERPYQCMFCDKAYTNSTGLWQHQLTHTGKYSK